LSTSTGNPVPSPASGDTRHSSGVKQPHGKKKNYTGSPVLSSSYSTFARGMRSVHFVDASSGTHTLLVLPKRRLFSLDELKLLHKQVLEGVI